MTWIWLSRTSSPATAGIPKERSAIPHAEAVRANIESLREVGWKYTTFWRPGVPTRGLSKTNARPSDHGSGLRVQGNDRRSYFASIRDALWTSVSLGSWDLPSFSSAFATADFLSSGLP